jgi:2,3-diketo-5-methylthio-1-phosphopentane phosphatase
MEEMNPGVLISDFDGTITETDFYALIDAPPDYLAQWRAGRLTHFEAMAAYFAHAPDDDSTLNRLLVETQPDPQLGPSVQRLCENGWDLVVVSAGSNWYIDRILSSAGVQVPVHSNPGRIVPGRGLQIELPRNSPHFSRETGIDKAAVVRQALGRYHRVAYAGDGVVDYPASLLVTPEYRFARRGLAQKLADHGERFHHFQRWSDIVLRLTC